MLQLHREDEVTSLPAHVHLVDHLVDGFVAELARSCSANVHWSHASLLRVFAVWAKGYLQRCPAVAHGASAHYTLLQLADGTEVVLDRPADGQDGAA